MEKIKRLLRAIKRIIKGEDDELLEQLSDFPNPKDIVNQESEYEKKIAKLLRKERSFFIGQISARLSEKTTLDDISTHLKKEAFTTDEFDKEMEKVNKTFLGQSVKLFSKKIMEDIDKDVPFVGVSKDTNDRIKSWSKELATHVKEHTHQAIERELLLEKTTEGSPEAFLRVLRNLPEFDRSRARTIAVTETMTAQGIAEWEAYRQSPAVNGKTWQHSLSGGGMSRPSHVSLSGTTIGTNEEFHVNGYQAQFPRDPSLPASERVKCRCRLVPSIDQSVLQMSKEEKEKLWGKLQEELQVEGTRSLADDYANIVNSNKVWSWADDFPGGADLTYSQRKAIRHEAIERGLIPDVPMKTGTRYPDFASANLIKKVDELPEKLWLASDREQFDWLDSRISGGRPEGTTWHHSEIPGRMELVPFGIHNIINHKGGRSSGHWAYRPQGR